MQRNFSSPRSSGTARNSTTPGNLSSRGNSNSVTRRSLSSATPRGSGIQKQASGFRGIQGGQGNKSNFVSRNFRDSGSMTQARRMYSSPTATRGGGPGGGRGDGRGDGRGGNFDRPGGGDGRGGNFDRPGGGDGRGGNFDRRGGDGRGGDYRGGKYDGRGGKYAGGGRYNNYRNGYYGGYGRRGFNSWWGFYPGFAWGGGWRSPYWYYSPWLYSGWGYGGWGGYGYGYPYDYGYGGYAATTTYLYADADAAYADAPAIDQQPPAADQPLPEPTAEEMERASEYIGLGEQSFQAGSYEDALRHWQHAMVDNPNNGAVVLLMSQALFALGEYDSAANSVQMAMQMLPESEWGTVVKNYSQLYSNIQVYTDQIRAAEKARDAEPQDGAIHFLLGYHFGYLNYPKQAVKELDKALDIEPRDAGAQEMRDLFAKQANLPARPAAAVPAAVPPQVDEGSTPDKTPAEPPVTPKAPPAPPEASDEAGVPAGA